ncbi:hypothetical protein ACMFMG_002572 [Clarireedia jacksonii]
MSVSYVNGGLILLAIYVTHIWATNLLRWRALRKWGEKNGCEEPKILENVLPGGIEKYMSLLFKAKKDFDLLEDLIAAQYRTVGRTTYRSYRLVSHSHVATFDPENLQAILATRFNDYSLGESRSKNLFDLLGHGIFTADGEAWAHYRQQLKPQFSRDQVSDLEAAERHLQILYRALPQNNFETIDIFPLLLRFTMDVSTEFLFGQSVNSQTTALHSEDSGNKKHLQEEERFVEAITYSQDYIIWRLRLSKLWWLARSKKFRDACQTCKDFTSQFVQSALDSKRFLPPVDDQGKEKFVLLNALTSETRNPIELRDQMLHVLLAGRDTTAALLAWSITLLSRHPEIYAQYRSVVLSHFGTTTSPTEPMTFTSLKACKELTYLLYETIRLYPIVPINSRVAIRDTILPVGGGADGRSPVAVRKGEVVTYATYMLHRRKDIWGEDAEEWKPERWVGRKLGWEFMGFSGGPRVCIGQQYALNEASFVIARFLQKYERIEAADMHAKLQKKVSLTMSPAEVKIRLFPAAEQER